MIHSQNIELNLDTLLIMTQKDALNFLLNRRSCGRLIEPGPTIEQLELMIRAASRAADHANLEPWRFIVLEGEQRQILANALLASAQSEDEQLEEVKRKKILSKPFRAPMIIVAVSKNIEHPKVPVWEQELATAASVQNLLNAAYILELGAYWRTGAAVFSEKVKNALKLSKLETMVGFIYLGTPHSALPSPKPTDEWQQLIQFGVD